MSGEHLDLDGQGHPQPADGVEGREASPHHHRVLPRLLVEEFYLSLVPTDNRLKKNKQAKQEHTRGHRDVNKKSLPDGRPFVTNKGSINLHSLCTPNEG